MAVEITHISSMAPQSVTTVTEHRQALGSACFTITQKLASQVCQHCVLCSWLLIMNRKFSKTCLFSKPWSQLASVLEFKTVFTPFFKKIRSSQLNTRPKDAKRMKLFVTKITIAVLNKTIDSKFILWTLMWLHKVKFNEVNCLVRNVKFRISERYLHLDLENQHANQRKGFVANLVCSFS